MTPTPSPTPEPTPSIEITSAVAQNIPPTTARPEPTPDTAQPPVISSEPAPSQQNEKKSSTLPESTSEPLFGPPRTAPRAGTPKVVVTENIPAGRNTATANSPPGQRSLFEPVVIAVPNADASRAEANSPAAKEPPAAPQVQPTPEPQPIKESARSTRVQVTDTLPTTADISREVRPRVTKESEPAPIAQCSVTTSDERLTLMKNGGSLGLLVGVGSPGELGVIKATASSPDDIQVTREAPIAGLEDRAVFSVKAVGTQPGIFKVVFEVPCGRHQITVNVR